MGLCLHGARKLETAITSRSSPARESAETWLQRKRSRRRGLRIRSDRPRIKTAPARSRAPRPCKVFPFQIARRSSGYPSAPIEAGKCGNVGPIVNRTRKILGLPALRRSGPSRNLSLAEVDFIVPGDRGDKPGESSSPFQQLGPFLVSEAVDPLSEVWSTAPPSGGLGAYRRDRAGPAWREWPPDSSPPKASCS